jgi:hypothetical protein
VTACTAATVEVQTAPVQEPPAIEKLVSAVTSPMELPYWSRLVAVYAWLPPAGMVAVLGLIAMEARAPAVTVRVAVSVLSK